MPSRRLNEDDMDHGTWRKLNKDIE